MDPLLSTYYKCLKNPLENFQGDWIHLLLVSRKTRSVDPKNQNESLSKSMQLFFFYSRHCSFHCVESGLWKWSLDELAIWSIFKYMEWAAGQKNKLKPPISKFCSSWKKLNRYARWTKENGSWSSKKKTERICWVNKENGIRAAKENWTAFLGQQRKWELKLRKKTGQMCWVNKEYGSWSSRKKPNKSVGWRTKMGLEALENTEQICWVNRENGVFKAPEKN